MRMEQLRIEGARELANRKECGKGGAHSLEKWADVRHASIEWKKAQGWDDEDAIGYTLATGCNRAALARTVRPRSGPA